MSEETIELFVNGTLMRGLALNSNLDGAQFKEETSTAAMYRVYSIDDVHPGMFAVDEGGVEVAGEIYLVPADMLREIEGREPPHLYRGPIRLVDGREVSGILYPQPLAERHGRDISEFGDWRKYMASK